MSISPTFSDEKEVRANGTYRFQAHAADSQDFANRSLHDSENPAFDLGHGPFLQSKRGVEEQRQ
jgi:hypothetical protein